MTPIPRATNETRRTGLLREFRDFNLVQKLRSGHYPTETGEKWKLSHLLFSAEQELVQYDVEIARLQSQINSLQNEKKGLEGRISFSQSLLSPIRKVPREVLTEIFEWLNVLDSVRTRRDEGIYIRDQKVESAVLNVGHVCAYWRNILHSTDSIWSRLIFGLDILSDPDGMDDQRGAKFLDWVLPKSGDSPLQISFEAYPLVESHNTAVGKQGTE